MLPITTSLLRCLPAPGGGAGLAAVYTESVVGGRTLRARFLGLDSFLSDKCRQVSV